MAILNYTTKIYVSKTLQEIQTTLVKHGADKISIDYFNKMPYGVTFSVDLNGQIVFFSLPTNTSGVLKAMQKNRIERRYLNEDHAQKVAWRILKDWIESQMAIVEAQIADLAEVFLPYAVTKSGNTLYSEIKNNPQLLLN